MRRPRVLVLLAAGALAMGLAPAAVAAPATTGADRADAARAEHDRIVAYWTPERMAAARPRDFVRQADGSFKLAPTPRAKPGGGTTSSSVTGASWTGGGDVLKRTGKVYFVLGTTGYVCSGAVADDGAAGGGSIVLTAGHCVYDEKKADGTGWATNWLFIPDFDSKAILSPSSCNAGGTYGCWTARRLVADARFTSAGGFNQQATTHDFAFAVVGNGGTSTTSLDGLVGRYQLAYDVLAGSTMSAFGYPAGGRYSPGNDLVYCSGPIGQDRLNANLTWQLACDMTGGSSGGPWLTGAPNATGARLGSLNSYGYQGKSFMYGPKFNQDTSAVRDAAADLANGGTAPAGGALVGTVAISPGQ